VIVREEPDAFLLVRQHDHGLASGEFARRFVRKPRPLEPTLLAVENHDLAWRELDAEVLWDEGSNRPYSFLNYPKARKMAAQRRGIDEAEELHPYAGCLCSMHYARFLERSREGDEVAFREAELERQKRLRARMAVEEIASLERNLRFLRLCDGLSLFVCLNEPGGEDQPPPYPEGFVFGGERFEPIWEDERTLRFLPSPFSEPFDLALPAFRFGKDREPLGGVRIELRVI
jgi:hypothetical protein